MVDKKDKKVLVSVKHLVQTFNAGKKDTSESHSGYLV
ncbi:Oligopeptide transport ATP-binding protein OppF [Lacticaseibacillus paracasei subsp. paracasei CNCM I-4648]|nr:Oligopeptide transport ATP-binding protein OppF [Lacticaseibacillus paracasei subsp. paracasei CNCM I-4648]